MHGTVVTSCGTLDKAFLFIKSNSKGITITQIHT